MDIYSSGTQSGKSRTKKLEHLFRTIFLTCSSVLVVTLFLVGLDKQGTLTKPLDMAGPPLLFVWVCSFVLWIIFLIVNSKVGKFIGKPISGSSTKKKKAGLVFLYIWLTSVVLFASSILLSPALSYSSEATGFMMVMFFAVIFILPAWAFLLGNRLVKILVMIPVGLVAMFFVVYLFILRPHKAVGGSMTPAFVSGEYMLSEKVTYYLNSPKRGDVVVFIPPNDKSAEYFARIVGLPSENISIRADRVFINDKLLDEPYLEPEVLTYPGSFIGESNILIPEDKYVMLGDNRSSSNDSRSYGFVEKSAIKGRIFYIYWPPAKRGLVK